MADDRQSFMIEDAELIFRNFEGREGLYNTKGSRNFAVKLTEDMAQKMLSDGWNVKWPKPGDEAEEDTRSPYIQIQVGYKIRPPHIVMITSTARTSLTEDNVEVLDWANIETADLIAVASKWEVNGKTGIKAYLKSLFVTIEEDALERKYAMNSVVDQ